jgi:iron complex outermembrane recepter protein
MNNKLPRKSSSKRDTRRLRHVGTYLAGATLMMGSVYAADSGEAKAGDGKAAPANVMELPLEELMKITVTSVSKKKENLSTAATAIHVISNEDIRRSGVTSIPEALRLSPGLEVARQDSHTWAISSRGFNDEFANQLLVLIDGRSVYTPLFAGVYWDVQDMMLEDLDRIEVIRGPGGTLWGANAVNGVINITSKSAFDTQGVLATGGGGTEEYGFGVRYGGKVGERGAYRVYGKYFGRDESELDTAHANSNDRWNMQRGGFRYDMNVSDQNKFTLQGDIYSGALDQTVTGIRFTPAPPVYPWPFNDDVDVSGANVLGKWVHSFSDSSELAFKVYYDHTWRDRVVFAETRDTFDMDLQHHFQLGNRNDIVWGVGYNLTADDLDNREIVLFSPTERNAQLFSAFVQDEISIIEDKLRLTLGTKVEHNDYTDWEVQPSARLSYTISKSQTAWFAASRAISTPSRAEHNITINQRIVSHPILGPTVIQQLGSPMMVSKELIGFELGYRLQAHERVTFDVASFYNLYDKQRSISPSGAVPGAPSTAMFTIGNGMEGESYGFEVASTFQPTDWWRLRANYSFVKLQLHLDPGVLDPFGLERAEGDSPVHQVGIRSMMDLPHHLELDGGMRYVDRLSNPLRNVPSYVVGDIRLGYRPNDNWEFSITGQNLFAKHKEFAPSYIQTQTTQVEASVFAKVTFRY